MSFYEISKQANIDLEDIWIHTFENWSTEQANYYYDLLMDEIEYISQNPKSGQEIGEIKKGFFRSRMKSHFIFYKINSTSFIVEIVRILHQQMDVNLNLD